MESTNANSSNFHLVAENSIIWGIGRFPIDAELDAGRWIIEYLSNPRKIEGSVNNLALFSCSEELYNTVESQGGINIDWEVNEEGCAVLKKKNEEVKS